MSEPKMALISAQRAVDVMMGRMPAIPGDARPTDDANLMSLLLAVRAWANHQSGQNANDLYRAALTYWGVSPALPG